MNNIIIEEIDILQLSYATKLILIFIDYIKMFRVCKIILKNLIHVYIIICNLFIYIYGIVDQSTYSIV